MTAAATNGDKQGYGDCGSEGKGVDGFRSVANISEVSMSTHYNFLASGFDYDGEGLHSIGCDGDDMSGCAAATATATSATTVTAARAILGAQPRARMGMVAQPCAAPAHGVLQIRRSGGGRGDLCGMGGNGVEEGAAQRAESESASSMGNMRDAGVMGDMVA